MSEGNLPGGLDQVKVIDIMTSSRPQRLQDMIKTSIGSRLQATCLEVLIKSNLNPSNLNRYMSEGNLPGCLDEIKVILGDEAAIIHSDLHEGSGFRV